MSRSGGVDMTELLLTRIEERDGLCGVIGQQPDAIARIRRGPRDMLCGNIFRQCNVTPCGAVVIREVRARLHPRFGSNARRRESPRRLSERTRPNNATVAALMFHQTSGSRLSSVRPLSIIAPQLAVPTGAPTPR